MKIYLVGGAVRDRILGRSVKDRDYLVVGASPEDLLNKGFKNVGKHFPVFIDPKTKEEYALARKEKKVAKGHDGFEFEFGPNISLEEDLLRRDFTINAMVEDGGEVIDPYGGQEDLKKGILRHVSKHFTEDPLRVIRGFRFASCFNFKFAEETKELLKQMIASGELDTLSSERVWAELKTVLEKGDPQIFFELCESYDLTQFVFPGLDVGKVNWNNFKGVDTESLFCLINFYSKDRESYFEKYTVPKNLKKNALLLKDTADQLNRFFDKDADLVLDFYKRIRQDGQVLAGLLQMVKRLYPDFTHEGLALKLLEALNGLDLKALKGPDQIQLKQKELINSYL